MNSSKGPNGGFFANKQTGGTILLDVLKITDGSMIFNQCALNIERCNAEHPCPLHHDFAACRDGMLKILAEKTIDMLAREVNAGAGFLT
ncbi:MAG: Rrf2 family transcriptional regulator [Saprospiraceae bacterium]